MTRSFFRDNNTSIHRSLFTLRRMMNVALSLFKTIQKKIRKEIYIVVSNWKHWDLSLVSRYYVPRGLRVRGQGQPPMWSGGRGWSPPASSTLSYSTGNLQSRVYIHISYGSDSFSERTETVEAGCLQGEHLFMTILPFGKGRVLPCPALCQWLPRSEQCAEKIFAELASGEWWVSGHRGAPHMSRGHRLIEHGDTISQKWYNVYKIIMKILILLPHLRNYIFLIPIS